MCITAKNADLTKTYIASYVVGRNHRLIYQNEAKTQESNAMILAIPGEIRKLTAYPKSWVSNLYDRLNIQKNLSRSITTKGLTIERVGSYIIGHTEKLNEKTSIDFCKEHGLQLNEQLINWFHTNYEGWSFVIAVFLPENSGDMHPISIDYKSFQWLSDIAFIPMVEGHGDIPAIEKTGVHQIVMVNNFVIIGEEDKLSTDNDDLYVKCGIMGFSTKDMFQKGQLSFEQNPKNLPFHY